MGDATGPKLINTPAGRLGSLICWEAICRWRATLFMPGDGNFRRPTWDTARPVASSGHIAKEAGRG